MGCKVGGCKNPEFKDGFCKDHYAETIKNLVKEIKSRRHSIGKGKSKIRESDLKPILKNSRRNRDGDRERDPKGVDLNLGLAAIVEAARKEREKESTSASALGLIQLYEAARRQRDGSSGSVLGSKDAASITALLELSKMPQANAGGLLNSYLDKIDSNDREDGLFQSIMGNPLGRGRWNGGDCSTSDSSSEDTDTDDSISACVKRCRWGVAEPESGDTPVWSAQSAPYAINAGNKVVVVDGTRGAKVFLKNSFEDLDNGGPRPMDIDPPSIVPPSAAPSAPPTPRSRRADFVGSIPPSNRPRHPHGNLPRHPPRIPPRNAIPLHSQRPDRPAHRFSDDSHSQYYSRPLPSRPPQSNGPSKPKGLASYLYRLLV